MTDWEKAYVIARDVFKEIARRVPDALYVASITMIFFLGFHSAPPIVLIHEYGHVPLAQYYGFAVEGVYMYNTEVCGEGTLGCIRTDVSEELWALPPTSLGDLVMDVSAFHRGYRIANGIFHLTWFGVLGASSMFIAFRIENKAPLERWWKWFKRAATE